MIAFLYLWLLHCTPWVVILQGQNNTRPVFVSTMPSGAPKSSQFRCDWKGQGSRDKHFCFTLRIKDYPFYFFKDFIYLFWERGREGERKGENHRCVVASWARHSGTWPAAQACALTGNQTSDPLVHRPAFNPLSHTSQGYPFYLWYVPSFYRNIY